MTTETVNLITAFSSLQDYEPHWLVGLGPTASAPLLGQVRALVWPLVEKELGK